MLCLTALDALFCCSLRILRSVRILGGDCIDIVCDYPGRQVEKSGHDEKGGSRTRPYKRLSNNAGCIPYSFHGIPNSAGAVHERPFEPVSVRNDIRKDRCLFWE